MRAIQLSELRAEVLRLRGIWLRLQAASRHTWCACEAAAGGTTTVRFFDEQGEVFDRLVFPGKAGAESALRHNGFLPLAQRPSLVMAAPLPRFPLADTGSNPRPVFSAGGLWHQPSGPAVSSPPAAAPARGRGDLERFVDAQDPIWFDVLEELIAGRKHTHWIWYVFPQLGGLGSSPDSVHFGLASLAEAQSYWDHALLGGRLNLCCQILLATADLTAADILGVVDARKLQSCVTLFKLAAPRERLFNDLLDRFFAGVPCTATSARVGVPG